MNENHQELLKLCVDRPISARELVVVTGDRVGTVSSRMHDLLGMGAVKRERTTGKRPVYMYQAVPGWKPGGVPELTTYKPAGICVWGVWM